MASFAFELVSPERLLISEQADEVVVPGVEGEFTVLAQHAPFITVLRPGFLTVKTGASIKRFYARGGFAEVNPEGLTILADFALPDAEFAGAFDSEIAIAETSLAHAHGDEARAKAQQQIAWIRDLRVTTAAH